MRSLLFILIALATIASTQEVCAENSSALVIVGRWRAETVPTGYWVIDRYGDGRYAKKSFLRFDYNKPPEIVVEWGRWKLEGKKYKYIIDGTNSATLQRFMGKWWTTDVTSVTKAKFSFFSSDGGPPRFELPEPDQRPLLKLTLKRPPPDLINSRAAAVIPPVRDVPPWVNGCAN